MTNATFDEATKIQEQLLAASGDLIKAQMDSEQASYAVRQTEQELENTKLLLYADQLSLGKEGALSGSNEKAREAQFAKFLTTQPDGVTSESKLKAQRTKEVNAKIATQSAKIKFDALKSVAEITIAKLGFETQSLVSQTVLKQLEAATQQLPKSFPPTD